MKYVRNISMFFTMPFHLHLSSIDKRCLKSKKNNKKSKKQGSLQRLPQATSMLYVIHNIKCLYFLFAANLPSSMAKKQFAAASHLFSVSTHFLLYPSVVHMKRRLPRNITYTCLYCALFTYCSSIRTMVLWATARVRTYHALDTRTGTGTTGQR